MILLITLLPLLNYLLLLTSARFVSTSRILAPFVVGNMALTLLCLFCHAPTSISGVSQLTHVGTWATSGLFEINWNFSVNALTYIMLIVVMTVSTVVHLYSIEYMSQDPHLPRFMSYLSLFTFFMLLLVTSDNFVNLFLGWEGVGLCSYLLISFWYTRVQANKSAIKAMIVNRVADLTFTVGILAVFYTFQTVEFNTVFALTPFFEDVMISFGCTAVNTITLIAILLFLGAMGKSAQIGLHTWLPDAMEGPTPVSALIHAATMVTAGVFLIIRAAIIFESSTIALSVLAIVGTTTAFMAATSGLLQNDIKKVIAYSTCSQLGYMVFACGLSQYALSLFHLTNHAFFKALLFLSAGAVIHAIANEQDLRRFGGLLNLLPYTYAMFVIGSLALMGFPFLTGFFSKDIILEVAAGATSIDYSYAYTLGLVTALFTSFYSFRLLYLTFYGAARSQRVYMPGAHELSSLMAIPLAVLSIGSIFFGYLARDLFIGFGTEFWNGVMVNGAPIKAAAIQIASEFLPTAIKMLPLFGAVLSVSLVFIIYGTVVSRLFSKAYNFKIVRATHRFLSNKWYFDPVYNHLINRPALVQFYNQNVRQIDKGLLEAIGPTGLGQLVTKTGNLIVSAQSGRVFDYGWFMLGALFLYVLNFDISSIEIFTVDLDAVNTVCCVIWNYGDTGKSVSPVVNTNANPSDVTIQSLVASSTPSYGLSNLWKSLIYFKPCHNLLEPEG